MVWNVQPAEVAQRYPADDLMPEAPGRWLRGIDVRAPVAAVYRRLCHLRVAPYSYDVLDNFGRRSPRRLQPWCEELEVGQQVMTIFTLASFEVDQHLTLTMSPGWQQRLFGELAVTYRVQPAEVHGVSRLVAVLRVEDPPGPMPELRRRLLARGDAFMMRRQLRTLAALAEADVHVG